MYEDCLSGCLVEQNLSEIERPFPDETGQETIDSRERALPVLANIRRIFSRDDSSIGDQDHSLLMQLQEAFKKSSYGLAPVQCEMNHSTIHLFGTVKSYFALQMAIQLTRTKASQYRILLDITVVPNAY